MAELRDASPHPWNDGFTWRDHDGPGRTLSAEQRAAFDADGFIVVHDVFDADTLAAVHAELAPMVERVNELLRGVDGGRISVAAADRLGVCPHAVVLSEVLRRFVASSPFTDVCADLVGDDVRLYWDQAVYKYPANDEPVLWHQDNGYTYVEPQDYLTCWVPLVDATLDNGCVWVLPGVHRLGTLAHREDRLGFTCLPEGTDGAVAVPCPAGSMVVFSSLTPHRTGPNHTDAMRPAYIVQYLADGAVALGGDPATTSAADAVRTPLDDPTRQFPILVGGVTASA